MEIDKTIGDNFEKKRTLYTKNFSLGYCGDDFSTKVALISLIGYLTKKVQKKKPNVSYLDVIKSVSKGLDLEEDFLYTLAIVCEDFSYGCKKFQTFGLNDKQIPSEINKILKSWNPF